MADIYAYKCPCEQQEPQTTAQKDIAIYSNGATTSTFTSHWVFIPICDIGGNASGYLHGKQEAELL